MGKIKVKDASELDIMRRSGRIVAEALELVKREARPGVTTDAIDRKVEELIREHDATPAFKGYRGFPRSVCTSINEQVVHGIPGERELESGDLLSADIGAFIDGYAGDAAVTVQVGECSEEAQELCRATHESLQAAIDVLEPGIRVVDISRAVEEVVTSYGFSVVEKYTGHGIGRELHEPPQIPNFVRSGAVGRSPVIPEGAVLAIEPMVNVGTAKTRVLSDGWTVVSRDRSLSAHFEHTVAVTA
ncbi:MAG: type I methionyl aminopeptidase, partial [Planctomycetota bacterium]